MVRSSPLVNGMEVKESSIGMRALGVCAILIGVLLWLPGARFTVDGWWQLFNGMAGWFGIAQLIPPITGVALVISALVVGIGYSLIEVRVAPVQMRKGKVVFGRAPIGWLTWLILVASDVGTTFIGLVAPNSAMPRAVQEISASPGASALVSVILTFLPELFILGGIRLFRPVVVDDAPDAV